ncbi:MAG: acyl carrier protein [Bacteroidaceae bacterium]|nr:acyl carrier protein [Bacteroidaceae bacterium]
MELNDFIENFANQFDDTDISEFKPDTEFKEMEEWTSLIAFSEIVMIKNEYGVTLKGDDIKNAKTIEDLFKVVSSRNN